jgi:uncharacterized membrane protein
MLEKRPDDAIWLLLTILTVWRVTALLAYESGPFGVFVSLRRGLVKVRLGRLVGCFYCLSMWISCAVVLVFPLTWATPVVILGVAGAVAIIERFLSGASTTGGDDRGI